MLCLLQSEQIFAQGFEGVPHYRPKAIDYINLLQGAKLADLLAIPDRPPRLRRDVLQLEDEAEQPRRRVRPRLALLDKDELEDGDPFVDSDLEDDFQALLDMDWAIGEDADPEPEIEQTEDPGGNAEDLGGEPAEALQAREPEALEDEEGQGEGVKRGGGKSAFIMSWGNGFVIRWNRGAGHKSLECQCPWHRRSAVTGCKRTLKLPAGTSDADGYDLALRALKWWANQATLYTTQVFFCVSRRLAQVVCI